MAELERIVAEGSDEAKLAMVELLEAAYLHGASVASGELGGVESIIGRGIPLAFRHHAIAAVAATQFHVVREAADLYRQFGLGLAANVIIGGQSVPAAALAAQKQLVARGITGFVDRAGRKWGLRNYLTMVGRTAAVQASVQGHQDQLLASGHDLVMVSDHKDECSKCSQWEGKVLSLSGQDARYASIGEARVAGLFHPRCRHRTKAYFAGVTKRPDIFARKQEPARTKRLEAENYRLAAERGQLLKEIL